MWTFQDYVAEDGSVPVEIWCQDYLTSVECAGFDVAVDYFRRIDDWDSLKKSRRKYREMDRELQGLTELKFDVITQENGKNFTKRFRPVGIMNRARREFIFFGGFQKGKDGPIPADAFKKILKHKLEFENNRGGIYEHKA